VGLVAIVAGVVVGCSSSPTDARARLNASSIDDHDLVPLPGNTHPFADGVHSGGPLPDAQLIEHMQLVLQRSDVEEAALEARIDAMHDPASPSYHHWLTVTQFADQYGVAPADIAVVTGWLRSHGMRVDSVAPSRMFIEFSATVAQLREAFHTQIDRLRVDGVDHMGNRSDPQIPKELAKVVAGVHALHDFMPHPMHRAHGAVQRDPGKGTWHGASPDFTLGPYAPATGTACTSDAQCIGPSTCNLATNKCYYADFYAVAPADFATIYDLGPLFSAGTTGTGVTVAVIEDTTLKTVADVATFRSAFGLSGYTGTFKQALATGTTTCKNPGQNGAEGEAALDAEWAGATAPGAAIELEACADTGTVFGGLIAIENLVNGASPPPIMSLSYGLCESQNGATSNKNYVNTYQQAAALGVSVFVSAGDEGAASCDANQAVATHGIAVSGFASTPYNVAVGGTDFMDYYDSQHGGPAVSPTYWSAANGATYGSALSYVPEITWDDSCASPLIYGTSAIAGGTYTQAYGASGFCNNGRGSADFRTTGSGSGGPSSYSSQPTWQTGVVGLPTKSGGPRYLPDVSLFAADGVYGHFLVYCMTDAAQGGGPCVYTNVTDTIALAAGGTSFAAPSLAGIQALIDQTMGGSQGNPNYTFYKLAAAEQGALGSTRCNSTGGTVASPLLPQPECIFHDVTQGTIDVNCTGTNCYGSTGTTVDGALSTSTTALAPAFNAGVGWDYATGLGTVDAYNLVTAWSK
jgi:subtilase family serine protease